MRGAAFRRCLRVIVAMRAARLQRPSPSSPRTRGSSAFRFCSSASATGLACRGLPSRCRGPGHFSLRGQRKVTKREATPMARLPGCALQVRGWVTEVCRQGSCPDDKLAGIPAGHPAGFSSTHPPRHRGPGERWSNPQSQSQRQNQRKSQADAMSSASAARAWCF
jgi:hypothetical protein